MKTVNYAILCNGQFPQSRPVLEELLHADLLICCDGAVSQLAQYRDPDVIIGDLDSIPDRWRKKYASILLQVTEQETNDLSKAFRWLCARMEEEVRSEERRSVKIFGAAGKREDHTLGNISLLADFAQMLEDRSLSAEISMITDHGLFLPLLDSVEMDLETGRSLSIFSFDPTLRIRSQGLQYPVDDVVFDMWWKATLNRVSEKHVTLHFSHRAKVLLYLAEE